MLISTGGRLLTLTRRLRLPTTAIEITRSGGSEDTI